MATHLLERSQIVHSTLDQCWAFFSDPRNLAEITPRSLSFEVLSDLPARIHAGLMIEYRVRPLLGLPMRWLTEITHVQEPAYFVDEQRAGPYRLWHHEHFFTELPGGKVEIRDRVHYQLPFTPLSEFVHPLLVAPELEKIFSYREKVVAERFR